MGVEPSDAGADQERIDKPAPVLKDGIPRTDERLEAESEFSPLEIRKCSASKTIIFSGFQGWIFKYVYTTWRGSMAQNHSH